MIGGSEGESPVRAVKSTTVVDEDPSPSIRVMATFSWARPIFWRSAFTELGRESPDALPVGAV